MKNLRTRFAPSPTGSLHVGGARTALYCLLLARSTDGRFVLRIEDTDQARSTEDSTRGILRDLEWLGLAWDEGPERGGDFGPYLQSERLDLYNRFIEQLLESGRAYEAWDTREELTAQRDRAAADKSDFVYRRPTYSPDDLQRFADEGRQSVVRLAMPDHDIIVQDEILGEVVMPVSRIEDLVIRKADGYPTYHFAVVIDDHHMEISLVLRGQEHLMNTPKHLAIYEALGWQAPRYAHVPLIMNLGGGKMSKRDKAKAARAAARERAEATGVTGWKWLAESAGVDEGELVRFMKKKNDAVDIAENIAKMLDVQLPPIDLMDFRKEGFLAQALVNYLALLGWSPGDDREIMGLEEMQKLFTLDRVGKTAAQFDPQKLRWLCGETIRRLSVQQLATAHERYREVAESPLADLSPERRTQLIEMYRQRMTTFKELDDACAFFFEAPTTWDEKAADKHLLKAGGLERLGRAREALSDCDWTNEGIEAMVQELAEELDVGMGKIAQPLRIAVTGGPVSPGIGETLAFLPRQEVLDRISACLQHFAQAE